MTAGYALPPLPQLPDDQMMRGADPDLLRAEVYGMIYDQLSRSPRSLQKTIGPSEVGTPCRRRLGYALNRTPKPPAGNRGWIPAIGTSVHEKLAEIVATYNTNLGWSRYLLESRVEVGMVGGQMLTGNADVYDRVTATVIDWKIVGITTLKSAKRKGPSDTYRGQIHCYGLGFENRGLPVDNVVIAYLPRNGELWGGVWHTEPYDRAFALDTVARADAIATALTLAPPGVVLSSLTKADDCGFCPWKVRSLDGTDADPETSCPGFAPDKPTTAEELTA